MALATIPTSVSDASFGFVPLASSLDELRSVLFERLDDLAVEEDLEQLFPDEPELVQRRAARGRRGWGVPWR